MSDRYDIALAVRSSVEAVERLARTLYRAMAHTYRQTLLALAHRYGLEQSRVVLSAEIRQALSAEAHRIATRAMETYDRLVSAFIDRNGELTDEELVPKLKRYMRERAANRSALVVGSAVNPAKLDAIVGFYRENGVEPEFDFRGNEGPPSCLTCTELVRTSPHSAELVLAVGYPHLGCSHSWHVKGVKKAQLRSGGVRAGRISLGRGEVAGIIGIEPLLMRTRSQEDAVAEIRRLKQLA